MRLALWAAPGYSDAAAVAAICAIYPFGEWAIHVYLLHLPPVRWRGRRVEVPTAASHRMHHEDPHNLNMVLLAPLEAGLLLFGALPVVIGVGALLVSLVAGPVPPAALASAWLAGSLLVLAYEWTHFLIHTAHQPRSRHFAAIHRQHRLHHFKNEHYWHGITSTVGDRAFRTNPDQREVERSRTARRCATTTPPATRNSVERPPCWPPPVRGRPVSPGARAGSRVGHRAAAGRQDLDQLQRPVLARSRFANPQERPVRELLPRADVR